MKKVVVVGTGIMAVGIAAGFLAANLSVILLGRSKARADEFVNEIEQLTSTINPQWQETGSQITTGEMNSWSDWGDVIWVIETVSEDMALKQKVFAMLDQQVPPHIPIGSNSSGFPISKISAGLSTANRMLNAHYFMPAHIVPLVEVVLGEKSDPAIGEQVCEMYRAAGKKPVLVKKDIPGFLANRIQHALMREALSLVDAGIATPDDVDAAVRYSFGFRYAAVGPMTQKEISGWEGMAGASVEIWPDLYNVKELQPSMAKLIAEGKYGMKSKEGFRTWSDEEIAQMRKKYNARLKAAFNVLQVEPDES
jgi:3-hydroxybutyryl-CoA dehydrogenase